MLLGNEIKQKRKISTSLYLAFGYLVVILLGTILLVTPFANANFAWTWETFVSSWSNPVDALFTSASAACVTGLITVPTGTYWSLFGQIVILLLIQLGGLGFVSIMSIVILVFKRRMNIAQRKIAMQASGMLEIGDVTSAIKRVVSYTLVFETAGACLLMVDFVPKFGPVGVYYGIFTAISAFCNAGFALFNDSLMGFASNYYVLSIIMFLIVFGGIGFIVWENLFTSLFRWRKFKLHTKLVLIGTLFFIFIPAILFFLFENHGEAFEGMNIGEKLINSLFQSVTCRTAGFNTFEISKLSDSSIMLSNILMLIGGSSGSTAGGVKITTFIVLFLAIISAARRADINVGKRRIEDSLTRQASAIFVFYLILVNFALVFILIIENTLGNSTVSFRDTMFEVISAIGTVGLSAGGTENLNRISQILLAILMYVGRTGGLTIIYIFAERANNDEGILKRPSEKVLLG